jgi:uncharacterized protein YbcV (DUF1398 family)
MLTDEMKDVMRECGRGSVTGAVRFPEVLQKLMAIGVESYHADIYRHDTTYYLPSGESFVEDVPEFGALAVADAFCVEGVRRAIARVQQAQIGYIEFMEQIAAAGVAQYWVYLEGRRAVYTGRSGEEWVEWFPLV